MVWEQKIADIFQGTVVNHQSAQKPLLRFEVMRRDAVCRLFFVTAGRRSDPPVCHHRGTVKDRRTAGQILSPPVALKLGRNVVAVHPRLPTVFPLGCPVFGRLTGVTGCFERFTEHLALFMLCAIREFMQ
jgi:hypothetical protein